VSIGLRRLLVSARTEDPSPTSGTKFNLLANHACILHLNLRQSPSQAIIADRGRIGRLGYRTFKATVPTIKCVSCVIYNYTLTFGHFANGDPLTSLSNSKGLSFQRQDLSESPDGLPRPNYGQHRATSDQQTHSCQSQWDRMELDGL
jgi:hypothetical protein